MGENAIIHLNEDLRFNSIKRILDEIANVKVDELINMFKETLNYD